MNLRVPPASLRTGIAAAVVAGAVHLAQSRDMVVDFTRPIVLGTLRLFGTDAVDCGEELRVGKLLVPWTRDCAGINLLFILLALAVWVNRKERRAWRFWLCMLGMVPAAAAANVLRVLTLLAYRTVAYPGVESPQTHYFIGFIWLVPFITFITPRDHRPLAAGLMETLHAAAVVALLAPQAGTPNATLLTLAAVLSLSQCKLREDLAKSWPMAAWVSAGSAIALVGMESFWLPWLLLCPLLAPPRWVFSVPSMACLACTHSLIVMQPWSWAIAAAGLAWAWFFTNDAPAETPGRAGYPLPAAAEAPDTQEPSHALISPSQVASSNRPAATPLSPQPLSWAAKAAFFTCLTFPFLASTLLAIGQQSWEPPATVASRCISPNCYEVRLPGQPDHIGLACYSSASRDRHHTLAVCLKYRGIELTPVEEDSTQVLTDGTHWFREFFLQDGHLLPDYPSYVRSTFIPWSDPGVHLIFVSAKTSQTPAEFSTTCEALAQTFYQECAPNTKSENADSLAAR